MHISMIKKIKEDGTPCRKCNEIEQRLRDAGLLDRIDRIIIADERDPNSAGMQLAARYDIDRAPFFLVEEDDAPPRIYTVYFKFLKEILGTAATAHDEVKDIMDSNPDIDFL